MLLRYVKVIFRFIKANGLKTKADLSWSALVIWGDCKHCQVGGCDLFFPINLIPVIRMEANSN